MILSIYPIKTKEMNNLNIILFIAFVLVGGLYTQKSIKLSHIRALNNKIMVEYQSKKEIALKQLILIEQMDNIKNNCRRCSKIPVFENRN